MLSIEQRLQSSREAEEEKIEGRRGRHAYALGTTEFAQREGGVQLPPAGARPECCIRLGPGYERVGGRVCLGHRNNRFEDGYEAQLPTVTVGADYRINEWLLAGLALNYTNYDGTYDDSGGSDKHIFGPLLYATFVPFEGAFANVILGYARQENRNNRNPSASSCGLPGQPGLCGPEEQRISEGHTSADYSENQYTAGILAGYDQPGLATTIGPRLGFLFSHEQYEAGGGNAGLELHNNLDQTSVQSSLGVQASMGFQTAYGVVVPQAAVAWVHEYANSDRYIDARLIEAPNAESFQVQRTSGAGLGEHRSWRLRRAAEWAAALRPVRDDPR